ncbi:hypothetical protein A3H09_02285 [Candidatus Falkowbacteria bacterium RIFCSPLOWO2_12_FULL_45_13]|uniref:Capsule polysaccharide biosynthesis protein n=1 Tax=Candidatus Falkowbacteria bacterium RIFCSPLOWO2_12_FULL_45_13 TaxID=1797991 RepID=A0A1F5SX99_9BACT|nr:MAG: hypothetical protein A3H09_02285 [Candidatus Falkowbacteria bacterium RIFCSPLOWO2_12_FULL_45_13]
MRLFLIWPSDKETATYLFTGLKQAGHEVVYWTGLKKNDSGFPGVIAHDHFDAWAGIPPPELAEMSFNPPEEELINKMSGAESTIMTMMNKHFQGMSVDERKNFYYNSLAYWYRVLNKFKPAAVLFSAFPHPIHSYLVYELARLLNIKTLMFDVTSVANRTVWCEDFRQGSRRLEEKIEKNQGVNFSVADLSPDIQLYLKRYSPDNNDATPEYFKKDLAKGNLKNKIILLTILFFKSFTDFSVLKKTAVYLKKIFKNNIQKEYRRVHNPQPDLSKKFIYAPLHYQPEANTSPTGGIFVSQILMIRVLAAALPAGWLLYVKEHPGQWLAYGLNYTDYRYPGYYRQIAGFNNVQLIPVKSNSFDLINKSQAVAVVSGTAGWEAILRGKSALVFGFPWYRMCPGAWPIQGVKSCRQALEKITGGYSPDSQSAINFLKNFELSSVRGYGEEGNQGEMKLSRQEYFASLVKVINDELKK